MVVVEPTQGPHTRNPYVGVGWVGRGEEEKISKLFSLASICFLNLVTPGANFAKCFNLLSMDGAPYLTPPEDPFHSSIHGATSISDVLLGNGCLCLN